MKYIDAEKLITEIERKRDSALERQKNLEKIGQETVLNEMIAFELNRLISFVASLQQEMELPEKYQTPDWLFEGQEQSAKGLEEDLKQEYDSYCHKHLIGEYLPSRRKMLDFARHFAEWGAEHLKR